MSQKNFRELMNRFETVYAVGAQSTEQERAESVQELAQAIVFAVLKRVYDPQSNKNTDRETVDNSGCSKVIESMKRELKRDIEHLNNLEECSNNALAHTFNKDGEVTELYNKDIPFMHERLSDGMELVNTAVLKLLELSADGHTNLQEKYTERTLSKKVYIREEDSAKFEDTETNAILEVFKTVRDMVDRSGALKIDASAQTIYLEELAKDEESGAEQTQYRRLPKKLQRAGDISIKGNGVTLTCTLADSYSVRTEERRLQSIEDMLSDIGATQRQAQIIKLREQGRGYKAIATYLGVTQRAIAKNCEGVAKKYIAKYGEPRDKRAEREQEQERREQEQREIAERVSVLRYHAERREQERVQRRAQERREQERAQERREQREQEQEQNTARARAYFTLRARDCRALISMEWRAMEQEQEQRRAQRAERREQIAQRERREREERESAERRANLERLYLKMSERAQEQSAEQEHEQERREQERREQEQERRYNAERREQERAREERARAYFTLNARDCMELIKRERRAQREQERAQEQERRAYFEKLAFEQEQERREQEHERAQRAEQRARARQYFTLNAWECMELVKLARA